MTARADVLVLGAGIVGVCVALAAQQAGMSVILADSAPPGTGTSFGNAGLIEQHPFPAFGFPRQPAELLRIALGRQRGVRIVPAALPPLARWLGAYWQASAPDPLADANAALHALAAGCVAQHGVLCEAAGIDALRTDGVLQYMATAAAAAETDKALARGTRAGLLSGAALARREPAIAWGDGSAVEWRDSAWVARPGLLVEAYAALFQARGGTLVRTDALSLEQRSGYFLVHGCCAAPRAVVALGPWSAPLLARFGYHPPLAVKRGYSQNFTLPHDCPVPRQPVIFSDLGVVLSPLADGVRLITGIELAPTGAPPSPVPMRQAIADALKYFPPLSTATPGERWMGGRPCTPDMLPIIGDVPGAPGLMVATAHNHWGLTLGPATGRLVAAMLMGEPPFTEQGPYAPNRFRDQRRKYPF